MGIFSKYSYISKLFQMTLFIKENYNRIPSSSQYPNRLLCHIPVQNATRNDKSPEVFNILGNEHITKNSKIKPKNKNYDKETIHEICNAYLDN